MYSWQHLPNPIQFEFPPPSQMFMYQLKNAKGRCAPLISPQMKWRLLPYIEFHKIKRNKVFFRHRRSYFFYFIIASWSQKSLKYIGILAKIILICRIHITFTFFSFALKDIIITWLLLPFTPQSTIQLHWGENSYWASQEGNAFGFEKNRKKAN